MCYLLALATVETYLYLLFDYFIEKNIYDENENIIEKNIIEKNIYNPDKILNRKSIHKYNDKGYILETNRYDSNGNLEFKWKFKCDEIGNITERNEYNNNGDITRKVVWIYDENKNAIGFNLYNSDGEPISKTINEFDKNNNMTKTEFSNYQNGEYIGGLTSFRSYEEGVLISETRYDIESGRTINDENYEYKFDTKGNWIEKIIYINNIPQFLIEREIEYFD